MKHYVSLDISRSWSGRDMWGPETYDFPSWCRHSSLTFVSTSVLVYVFLLSSRSCSPQLCQLSHLWFSRVNQIMKSLQRQKKRKFTLSIHKGCIYIYGVGASRRLKGWGSAPWHHQKYLWNRFSRERYYYKLKFGFYWDATPALPLTHHRPSNSGSPVLALQTV